MSDEDAPGIVLCGHIDHFSSNVKEEYIIMYVLEHSGIFT